jgi:hypothetical protein
MLELMLSTSLRPVRTQRGAFVVASLAIACTTAFVFVGCKSGGAGSGSGVSSANVFERQPRRGLVAFTVRSTGQPGQTVGDVAVAFTEVVTSDAGPSPELDGGKPPDCEPVAIGPCVVTSCVQGTPIGGGDARSVSPAGEITITDTTTGKSQNFTAGSGGYEYKGQAPIPAKAGDTVTFTATGGEAPAFTQTLVTPQPITPVPFACQDAAVDAASSACSIARSRDLTVTWSGGDQGDAVITLSAFGAGCNNAQSCPPLQSTAVCKFAVAVGTGTIPAGVLARFPEASLQVGYSAESSIDFADGDYLVRASAATAAGTQTQQSYLLTQ